MNESKLPLSTVVFIDDEPNRIRFYIRAIKARRYQTHELQDTDDAWEYFRESRPDVCAVVLDVMMPPGKHLADAAHVGGTRTGVFLYRRILEQMAIQAIHHHSIPIAVLTQVNDPETLKMLQEVQLEHRPDERFEVWSKHGLDPDDFADQFETWLKAVEELYGGSRQGVPGSA